MDKIWIYVWKQRKLGEIIEVCSGRDYKHLEKGNVPVYGTGGYMLSVSKALSADKDAVGIGRKGTIDKPYILKAPFWTVDTLFYCVSKKDCDLNFIFDIFQNINWKALDESTGVPSLSKAVINKVKVLIPSVVEQIKIGRYFSLLDNRITFHHRKSNLFNKTCRNAWEQRKLGDFGKATGGTSIESEFSEDGIYKVISIGSYSENSVYNDQGIRAIKSDKTSNRVLNRNDLTMILNDKTTSGNIIGRVLLIEESGIYVYNQRTERIEINLDEYDPVFLYEMLNAPNIREKIIKQAQGNTQIYVNWTAISLLEYMIPSKEEQVKIGEYLHSISNLITLHQRKYDETKKLKKCMLQKMFPKEGEKVPEIRFSGFTGDWKQRKLGEIVNRITRKNSKLISELPLTISAQQGLIDQNEFFDKRVASKDVSGYYLIKNGEFAYNRSTSNDAPWGAIKRLDRYENGVLSTLYIVFEIKDETLVNSDFLVAYYSTNLWYKGIHEIAAEGARNHGLLNIAPTDFFKTKLKLPADIEEQQEIGEYFKKIDSLITFHQQKCDELKNIKKFMLQNMFVSEK